MEKHRLPLLWMHVYSCVAWQQTSYSSVFLFGADHIGNTVSLLLLPLFVFTEVLPVCYSMNWNHLVTDRSRGDIYHILRTVVLGQLIFTALIIMLLKAAMFLSCVLECPVRISAWTQSTLNEV
jgi:hypothetical protein